MLKTGPTIGTAYKGIIVSRVCWIAHFPQAIGAWSHIRACQNILACKTNAWQDIESIRCFQDLMIFFCNGNNFGQRRQLFRETGFKICYLVWQALHFDGNAMRSIAYKACKIVSESQPPYKWPETNSLNLAGKL